MQRGDFLVQVDAYPLTTPDADIVELMGLIRARESYAHRLVLKRATGAVNVRVESKPMRSLLSVADARRKER